MPTKGIELPELLENVDRHTSFERGISFEQSLDVEQVLFPLGGSTIRTHCGPNLALQHIFERSNWKP